MKEVMKGDGSAFMDRAEKLGIKKLIESFASFYAGRREGMARLSCLCDAFERGANHRDSVIFGVTHDLTCPCHRIVVLCGNDEDRARLREGALDFAKLCVTIDRDPAGYIFADVAFARSILGKAWLVDGVTPTGGIVDEANPLAATFATAVASASGVMPAEPRCHHRHIFVVATVATPDAPMQTRVRCSNCGEWV